MAIADLTNARPIIIRRYDDTVGAGHAFEDDRCNLIGALVLDHLLDMADAFPMTSVARPAEWTTITIRVEKMNDARHGRLNGRAAIIAGQRDCAMRRAVIRTIARQNLMPACIKAGDLDGVLIGFRATQSEEGFFQITGGDLAQFLSK